MSIVFGIARTAGQHVKERELLHLAQATEKYAPDGTFVFARDNIGMGFQAYNTHQRTNLEELPWVDAHGNVLSFDGRLDNQAELCASLELCSADIPDSRIVLKAYERWGEHCFSQLIGDWALSLWVQSERTLYLARDHAGSRSLYFERVHGGLLWSTYLETFFTDGRTAAIDEDFAALYFACRPTRELTPYRGIKAVPAAHFLRFKNDAITYVAHWHWVVQDSIVYDTALQYEEHFLQLFQQSVKRRSGPGAPVLAELSGGMDSTSIVCMSDLIRRSQNPPEGLLETVSFYDNSEPTWNEFPFFTAVETNRGKAGLHLNASYSERTIRPQGPTEPLRLWPGADSSQSDLEMQLRDAIRGRNIRSVLSGLGGDEVLGGVPTALPELADLLAGGRLCSLTSSGVEWCMANRVPLLHMLVATLDFSFRTYIGGNSGQAVPPWLNPQQRARSAGGPAEGSIWNRLHCWRPSRIANGDAWWSILETLPNRFVSNGERLEYRYPYLDRDLVEFLFSIPRRQLVEPGRRRSLMRRALKNIVPIEVLERRRKAYILRGPINLIQRERDWLAVLFRNLRCAEMGLVDPSCLTSVLDSIAREGNPKWMPYLMRLVSFEFWLSSSPTDIPPPTTKWAREQDPNQVVLTRPSRFGNSNH